MPVERNMIDCSIIIVSYNCKDVLVDCIRSIPDGAKGIETEIILVDNASTDGTPDFVKSEFPNVKLIANSDNKYFSAANNQGMKISKGRYICCLNPDTIVHKDTLTKMIHYMDENLKVGAVGPKLLYKDGSLQPSCRNFLSNKNLLLQHLIPWGYLPDLWRRKYATLKWSHDSIQPVDWVIGACIMVRKEVIDKVGYKDEDFPMFHEETDWCYRMWKAGYPVYFYPDAYVTHLGGETTEAKWGHFVILRYYLAKHTFIKKHFGMGSLYLHRFLLGCLISIRIIHILIRWPFNIKNESWKIKWDCALAGLKVQIIGKL